ncbi:unnamed protein product [[Candida] boidinii]|nr:unnamed protein product [[Candida] boidinii]
MKASILFYWGFLPVLAYSFFNYLYYTWLPSNYVFDKDVLKQICNDAISKNQAGNITNIMVDVTAGLQQEYGTELINDFNLDDWVFNNAGGAMGMVYILLTIISLSLQVTNTLTYQMLNIEKYTAQVIKTI